MNKKFIYCAILCNGWSRVEKNVIADDLNKALEVVISINTNGSVIESIKLVCEATIYNET